MILEGRVSRAEGRLGEGGPEEISGVGSRFGGGGQWGRGCQPGKRAA